MNAHDWIPATSGAILTGYLVIGAILWRCWIKTQERLFARFALAFHILAIERFLLLSMGENQPHRALVYITRLIAFLIIIWSIWRQRRSRS